MRYRIQSIRTVLLATLFVLLVLCMVPEVSAGGVVHALSGRGVVYNCSSVTIWLTIEQAGRWQVVALSPGRCTNVFTQNVEAIWGRQIQHSWIVLVPSVEAWRRGVLDR